jgi:hypothetical protein
LFCGGCDATATVGPLRRTDTIESLTPEGWVMFDPWTEATYCSACFAEIVGEDDDA